MVTVKNGQLVMKMVSGKSQLSIGKHVFDSCLQLATRALSPVTGGYFIHMSYHSRL